jgi:hypothetical protein
MAMALSCASRSTVKNDGASVVVVVVVSFVLESTFRRMTYRPLDVSCCYCCCCHAEWRFLELAEWRFLELTLFGKAKEMFDRLFRHHQKYCLSLP